MLKMSWSRYALMGRKKGFQSGQEQQAVGALVRFVPSSVEGSPPVVGVNASSTCTSPHNLCNDETGEEPADNFKLSSSS